METAVSSHDEATGWATVVVLASVAGVMASTVPRPHQGGSGGDFRGPLQPDDTEVGSRQYRQGVARA